MGFLSSISQKFFPHDSKKDHFKALDGLRGLAVLFVLLSHSSNRNMFFHEYLNFQKIGLIGVYLFFVLSAYLLDRQIAIALMSGNSKRKYWMNYFLRRFLRIYPLFVLSILVHFLVTVIGFETDISTIKEIILHVLLIDGQSVFWSIPVEFKYYFISPLFMVFCHYVLKWDFKMTILFFVSLIIGSIALQYKFNFYTISTLRYLPIFLIGTIMSVVELLRRQKGGVVNFNLISALGISSLVIICMTFPYYFNQVFDVKVNFQHWKFYCPYAILWGSILYASKYGSRFLKVLFELKFLRFLGVISYSAYLFHMPILEILSSDKIAIDQNFRIYLFFILTLSLSSLTYLLIEQPLSKIKLYGKRLTEDMIINKKLN